MARVKQDPRRSTGGPDELAKQTKKKQTRTQEPATFECQSPGCERKYVRKMSLTRHNKVDHVKELLPNGRTNSESQQQLASNAEEHNEEVDNTTDGQVVLPAVSQPDGEGVVQQEQPGVGDSSAAVQVFPGLPRPSQAVLGHLLGEEEVVDEGEVEGGAGLRHQCRLCGSIFEGVAFLLYDHLEEEHGINNVDEKDLERHCVRLSAEVEEEAAAKKAFAKKAANLEKQAS